MAAQTVFIINPAAASGRVGRRLDDVRSRIRARHPGAELLITEGRGDATRLARACSTAAAVVACGGDGTVHETAAGLVEAGGSAALGVIGIGTGNDLSRALGMGRGLDAGLDALARSGRGRMDYMLVEADSLPAPVPVFNNVGLGFDAYASLLSVRWKRLPGSLGYTAGIFGALLSWDGPTMRMAVDGRELEVPLMFTTLGNGHSSGGGYLITPDASPFSGQIDVCVVRTIGLLRAITMMPSTRTGKHVRAPEVTMLAGREVRMECDGPVPIHCDGEVLSSTVRSLTARIIPGALPVLAPRFGGAR